MLYIPRISDYLESLIDKNFGECLKSMREELYSKLDEDKFHWQFGEWLYTFLKYPDEVENFVELVDKTESNLSGKHVVLMNVYVIIISRFWILSTQNHNLLALNPKSKTNWKIF